MTDILALIPARGGSKGLPGKNIRLLAGKPLISWTIEAALNSKVLNRVIVTTDDEKIARIAREWGAEVPFIRPANLADDTSSSISVVEHALQWLKENENYKPDYNLLLQPTSPLRTYEDIRNVNEIAVTRQVTGVVSVCEANPHPYIVKKITQDGMLEDFIALKTIYDRRQDMPSAYAINGAMYLNHTDSLLKNHNFCPKDTVAYIMPKERSIDIDTPWDFQIAEFILNNS